jgi:hypothetical protein
VRKPFLRLGVLASAMAMATALMGGSLLWQVPSARAAGASDGDAREMARLINGARAASGKSALKIDVLLSSVARDGAIPCPDDPAKTISGRSLDFATYNQMSHQLRQCDASDYTLSTKTFVSTLQTAWGYGSVGEILLVNGGYGNAEYLYTYGGWSTWTYATTGHGMTGWASSSSHWNIIMGSYDRFGCGAWSPSGSTIYYTCLFSVGGPSPSGLAAAPTASPFNDPLPAPAETPIATPAPSATPAPARTPAPATTRKPAPRATVPPAAVAGTPTPEPTQSSEPTATPAPTATPTDTTSPTPVATVWADESSPAPALALVQQATSGPGGAAANLQSAARGSGARPTDILIAAAAAAAWMGLFGLLLVQRRRRLRHTRMATA